MYFRFRGCPLVLDIELSVSAWYQDSTCTVLLRARCLLLLLLAADSKDRQCAVCGITFKITRNMERKQKNDFVPIRTKYSRRIQYTPTSIFYLWKLPTCIWTCELDPHER